MISIHLLTYNKTHFEGQRQVYSLISRYNCAQQRVIQKKEIISVIAGDRKNQKIKTVLLDTNGEVELKLARLHLSNED